MRGANAIGHAQLVPLISHCFQTCGETCFNYGAKKTGNHIVDTVSETEVGDKNARTTGKSVSVSVSGFSVWVRAKM